MELGMIGLGRMGMAMVRRLQKGGHRCVAYDISEKVRQQLPAHATVPTLQALAGALKAPRVLWFMVPAAVVDATLRDILPHLAAGDVVIDGGNSHYPDAIRRARELGARGIHFVDVGTSGGVWGEARGYCLMIGGDAQTVRHLEPIFKTLAPGIDAAGRTPGRGGVPSTAEEGYLHCGPVGAGHFVKMIHNGIEYGMMGAYAEGLNILRHANVGDTHHAVSAETTPLKHPEHYQYNFNLADITELWRRGSVIGSWLLDLAAGALHKSADLAPYNPRVSDSGEGRWTLQAAIDEAVPAPILSAAVYARFSSRGQGTFADQTLSALRQAFGGHT